MKSNSRLAVGYDGISDNERRSRVNNDYDALRIIRKQAESLISYCEADLERE